MLQLYVNATRKKLEIMCNWYLDISCALQTGCIYCKLFNGEEPFFFSFFLLGEFERVNALDA